MADGGREQRDRWQSRRCCQAKRRANGAEIMTTRPVIVASRTVGLGLRRSGYCSGRNLKIFNVDVPKRQEKLDRQGKQSCPGTQTAFAPKPMHFLNRVAILIQARR